MKIDEDAIRKLADLLDETNLTEIEVAEGEQAIRVSRGQSIISAGSSSAPAAPIAPMGDPGAKQIPNTAPQSAEIAQDHPGAVTSPMVGTAYLQPEPGASSFAEKGSTVQQGDTLLIIEAMKVMNPIKAHRSGTVTKVLIENAQPVEFGDVLFVIE